MICTNCGGTIVVGEGTDCQKCGADMSRKNAFKPTTPADEREKRCPWCGTSDMNNHGMLCHFAKRKTAKPTTPADEKEKFVRTDKDGNKFFCAENEEVTMSLSAFRKLQREIATLQIALAEKDQELQAYDSTVGGMTKDINDLQAKLNSLQKDHGEEMMAVRGEKEKEDKDTLDYYKGHLIAAKCQLAEKDKRIRKLERLFDKTDDLLVASQAKLKATDVVVAEARELSRACHNIECMIESPDNLTMQTYDRDFREGTKAMEIALSALDTPKQEDIPKEER